MRLGAPVFVKTDDSAELARAHRRKGFRAAYCPKVSLSDPARVRAVRDAYTTEGVVIAEVGAWCNFIAPDPEVRRKNQAYVCERLALADEVGALCCVDYTGTFHPDSNTAPHPMNLTRDCFDLIVESARKIIDAVRPGRAKFTLEMMPAVFPDSADSYAELIAAVDRPALGVHLDPVNIITSPSRCFRNGEVIRECFEKLGRHVISCHGKDVTLKDSFIVEIRECRPGAGTLDYRAFLTELSRLPGDTPLMLEHLREEADYDLARDYVVSVAGELGLSF
ncbi:MAG: hypothetical protein A3F84_04495 [Candidatus Handelsmanbacteria bacterium RIFCSPLOWO2_12_FULL_64_10]|uniref:Xylose isomerase-like TIM barrel domain-containing protein n=1 Tax=Handelsmanbacteria sp. (strain RIFCSPLOWO2_12_FULL_64_10) TaxID=1817868 RepID=A0A1F6D1S8_HANXR|nr:MAG: hypothetical protein A3F84_04495 [Candidatus Handelsmanbacteria bacterium RIFCSPLOWO2_12_FULL_64_10]